MPAYVALLRAVNVGGTGKLPMATLRAMAEEAGFERVQTYIASGNLVFWSGADAADIRDALERRLQDHAGKPVGVLVRSADAMAQVRDANPFADRPANRTAALFTDAPLSDASIAEARNVAGEEMRVGPNVLYIFYGEGMAGSRLILPAAAHGTARNLNTVAKLADMAAALDADMRGG
jgi:uncharacterized protein (DUF1697 family)